jgi:hypothetical protein
MSIAAVSMAMLVGCGGGGGGGGSSDGKVAKATVDFNTTYVAIDFLNRGVLAVLDNFLSGGPAMLGHRVDRETQAIEETFECDGGGTYTVVTSYEAGISGEQLQEIRRFDHCINSEELLRREFVVYPWGIRLYVNARSISRSSVGPFEYQGEVSFLERVVDDGRGGAKTRVEVQAKSFTTKSQDYNISANYDYSYVQRTIGDEDRERWNVELDGKVEAQIGDLPMGWKAKAFSAKVENVSEDNETERAWVDGTFELTNLSFNIPGGRVARDAAEDVELWFAFDDFYVEEIDYDRNGTAFDSRYYEGVFGYSCMGGTMEVATPEVWDKNMTQPDLDGETGTSGTPYVGRSTLRGAGGAEAVLVFRENDDNETFATVSIGEEERNTTLDRIRQEVEGYCSEE